MLLIFKHFNPGPLNPKADGLPTKLKMFVKSSSVPLSQAIGGVNVGEPLVKSSIHQSAGPVQFSSTQ